MGRKKANQDLVSMSVNAAKQGKSYGELQQMETIMKAKEEAMVHTAKDKLALARYREVGTVEEFKELKVRNERNKLMTTFAYPTEKASVINCPRCGHKYETEDWTGIDYCMYCGQAIHVIMRKGENNEEK